MFENEVKVDKGFKQQVLRPIYATRDRSIALKVIKVSKLVQRKLIPYRSIIGLGFFERLSILEIIQNSHCAYRDLTIKSKLFKNIFLLSCLLAGRSPADYSNASGAG